MPLRLILAVDGSAKGVVVGNVDLLDCERLDEVVGVDGSQRVLW